MHAATSHSTHLSSACGEPDPSGLAPASLATIDPLASVPVRRGRGVVTRVRGGMVRRGQVMRHLAADVGQGTVEYVGLLLLMATLLAGVVAAGSTLGGKKEIGEKVTQQIGKSIEKAGSGK
ncbi:MAG: hypothetical protein Q7T55_25805 [Solirubrobacteraceae bacterium]|nr:hypothetical protein [Solirubrobacteraceae bacterium]